MMNVSDYMTRDVTVVTPNDTLQQAAKIMGQLDCGCLPVGENDRLVGMITDRDITVRATAAGLEPATHRVSEVMTSQTRWCTEDQSTEEVMRQMGDVQIRRLPVLDAQQHVVGIVSLGDLATRVAQHTDEVLRDVSWPSEPDRAEPGTTHH